MRQFSGFTAIALLFGAGLAVSGLPAAAQMDEHPFALAAQCDTDGNGRISGGEAQDCADQVTTAYAGTDALDKDQFSMALPEGPDAEAIFAEADADGDGQLTSDEWTAWQEEALAER